MASTTENRSFLKYMASRGGEGGESKCFKIVCFPGKKLQAVCITEKKNSLSKEKARNYFWFYVFGREG